MKAGEIRFCACGCGEPAKRCYSQNKFKSWRAYASGHAPNENVPVCVPSDIAILAYAAGIIDGEGCIYANVKLTKCGILSTYLQVSVAMCAESVVAWMARNFGGEMYVHQPPSGAIRTRFVWQVRGRNVGLILPSLLPYLIEKKQRATLAIELSGLIGQRGVGRAVPSGVMARRRELASSIKAFNQNQRSEDILQ